MNRKRTLLFVALVSLVGMSLVVGSAAAADYEVSDLNVSVDGTFQGPDAVAENDSVLGITANVTNNGTTQDPANVTFRLNVSGNPLNDASVVANQTVNLSAGGSTTVSFLGTAPSDTPANLSIGTGAFDHGVFAENETSGTINGSAEGNLSVFDEDDRNFLEGEIGDDTLDEIENAEDVNITITYLGGSGARSTDLVLVDDINVSELNDSASSNPNIDNSVGLSGFRNATDEYFINLPNFGSGTQFEIVGDLEGFNAFDGDTEPLGPGDGDQQNIRLERLVLPDQIVIQQTKRTALADGVDEIGFNVTVLGDVNGEPLQNADVDVVHNGFNNSIFYDGGVGVVNDSEVVTFNTGSSGFFQFNVSANRTQTNVDFTFSDPTGNAPDEVRQKSFILVGEGEVIGDVWDVENNNRRALENANVWAVQRSGFFENQIEVPVPNADGGKFFYRLVEVNASDYSDRIEILDVTQDYRIDNNGSNQNISISRVRELNETNDSVGSGWAVETRDAANATNMFVTPLEPTENDGNLTEQTRYLLERSDEAANASDERFVDPGDGPEFFERVDQDDGGLDNETGATDDTDPVVDDGDLPGNTTNAVSLSGNSTLAATKVLNRELVDTDIADGDEPTLFDSTDEEGEYVLDDLFADFQAGVEYVLVANKPGYEIEFTDALVTETGAFFEDGEDENFGLEPVEEDRAVNITNIAELPDLSAAPSDPANVSSYGSFAFNNTTDAFNQRVARDGENIDVVLIETFTEQSRNPVNESITLSVPQTDITGTTADDNTFLGEWVAVAGGTTVSEDPANATITVAPGQDGEAIAWLQTDRSADPLNGVFGSSPDGLVCGDFDTTTDTFTPYFEGIVGQSPDNAGIVDSTCKDFAGTLTFRSASISGQVTDSNDDPIPDSAVWTASFSVDTFAATPDEAPRFEVVPKAVANGSVSYSTSSNSTAAADAVDDLDDEFVVRRYAEDLTTTDPDDEVIVEDETVTAGELQNYSFDEFAVSVPGDEEFKLYDRVEDGQVQDSYTLDPVPARAGIGTTASATRYRIRGVKYDAPFEGRLGNDGLAAVFENTTDDANVVIPIDIVPGSGGGTSPATVSFSDQTSDGSSVTVDSAFLPNDGFVAIHNATLLQEGVSNGNTTKIQESVIGVSSELNAGTTNSITATLGINSGSLSGDATLVAMPHKDDPDDGAYNFPSDATQDPPYFNTPGDSSSGAVIDSANITVSSGGSGTVGSDNPFGDSSDNPLSLNDAADVLFDWNQDGEVNGTSYTESEMANFLFEWNQAQN